MFKTNFVIDDSVAAAQALAAAQSPLLRPSDGRVRASHNADLESLLAQAHSTHALSSTEAQYLHRLGAIADASHNADELGLALQRFDQKVYTDLGPDRSAAVLIASAVLNASARYWEGRIDRGMRITTYAGPAVSGDDQICTGDCTADEGTNPTPPDSSTFYPSADGSYYYNAYADTVYIVRIDTVFVKESGGFSTQAFWLIDGISAIGGGTIATVSGCGLITAGVCSGVVALLSAIVGSSTYAVSASAPPDGGGNASGGSTATGCPTGSYAWYDSGGTYCKPYPSSVQ